jgi:hypothetical protein
MNKECTLILAASVVALQLSACAKPEPQAETAGFEPSAKENAAAIAKRKLLPITRDGRYAEILREDGLEGFKIHPEVVDVVYTWDANDVESAPQTPSANQIADQMATEVDNLIQQAGYGSDLFYIATLRKYIEPKIERQIAEPAPAPVNAQWQLIASYSFPPPFTVP